MTRRRSRWLGGGTLVVIGLLLAGWALDRLFPLDLGRLAQPSVVVTDRDGGMLRAFLAADGAWRLPAHADEVDPLYLGMLLAYEDRRFAFHPGVDPLAVARALAQWAGGERGRHPDAAPAPRNRLRPERGDSSSSHHPALSFCLARDRFRKPVPTFRDHAPGHRNDRARPAGRFSIWRRWRAPCRRTL